MNTVAIPLTKPAGARPPIVPPTKTSFDSRPEEGGDPIQRRIHDSVLEVLKACREADEQTAPLLRRLIEQRKKIVKRELDTLRMFDPRPLPPISFSVYSLEFLLSDTPGMDLELDVERLYVRLLEDLDEADARLARILCEHNG